MIKANQTIHIITRLSYKIMLKNTAQNKTPWRSVLINKDTIISQIWQSHEKKKKLHTKEKISNKPKALVKLNVHKLQCNKNIYVLLYVLPHFLNPNATVQTNIQIYC